MVLRNPSAFDVYLCLSDVATSATAIAVLEPNGFYELAPADYNGVVSVICPAGAGSIAGSEMASSSFIVDGPWKRIPGGTEFYRLLNGAISVSENGFSAIGPAIVESVEYAFMSASTLRVYNKTQAQVCSYIDNLTGALIPVAIAEFDIQANLPGVVVL
jgi:hypothetical protein